MDRKKIEVVEKSTNNEWIERKIDEWMDGWIKR